MATNKFPSAGQLSQLEHDEQNHAKRVNGYIWNSNTGGWERLDKFSTVTERYDYANTQEIYVGVADVGTTDSATGWTITKYDLTDSSDASGKVATDVSWDNRTTGSYA